jgi:hypothetical protein
MHPTYRCDPSQMRPTPHLSPQLQTSQPINIRQADLELGPPRYMRKVAEIAAKPKRRSKAPAAGLAPDPSSSTTRSGAAARLSASFIRSASPLGRADQRSWGHRPAPRSRPPPPVPGMATPLGAGTIRGAPANSAGPDPDPPAPGAPAVPPPHPLPLPAR